MKVRDYISAVQSMANIYEYITEERFDTSGEASGHPNDQEPS